MTIGEDQEKEISNSNSKDERGFRVLGNAQALIDDRICIPTLAPGVDS
jgi:hypothetical protein